MENEKRFFLGDKDKLHWYMSSTIDKTRKYKKWKKYLYMARVNIYILTLAVYRYTPKIKVAVDG